jgi:hypothetical protein
MYSRTEEMHMGGDSTVEVDCFDSKNLLCLQHQCTRSELGVFNIIPREERRNKTC